MIIMKFGGTSVANTEAINRVISIVAEKLDKKPVIVVSALSKVTDLLYKTADAAGRGDNATVEANIAELRNRHQQLVDSLIENEHVHAEAQKTVDDICDRLAVFTKAVCALGELTPRSKARIISNGEWLSSTVICFALNSRGIKTAFADARKMIVTTGDYMKGEPLIGAIAEKAPKVIAEAYKGMDTVITQGFIASTESGETSVLGRGGSDYSASLIGMAVNASAIEIWTDVDGVRTTDPGRVANTKNIEKISFEEAAEMAHFGAKVLHPLTIEPAVMKNIPVYVFNTMNPIGRGTVILQSDQVPEGVKSVSFKENIYMLNIFSTRMIDVSGFLSKVFRIFAEYNVSVDLISTSEANISMTVDTSNNIEAVVAKLSEFAQVKVSTDKAQVSIIGKNVAHQRGLIRWATAAFKNISVFMISQGASSVNVSYVVNRSDLDEVLQELHQYLFEY